MPASRPRVSKWGTYYAKTYKNWMKEAGNSLADQFGPVNGEAAVLIEHVVQKPKTTKRTNPRGDIDNYDKAALDALTKAGIAWEDDDQVVLLVSAKRFADEGEPPSTHIEVYQC